MIINIESQETHLKQETTTNDNPERKSTNKVRFSPEMIAEVVETEEKHEGNNGDLQVNNDTKPSLSNAERVDAEYKRLEEEKNKWKKKKAIWRGRENLFFLLFTALFLTIILMQFDIPNRYKVVTTLYNFFNIPSSQETTVSFQYYKTLVEIFFNLYSSEYWFLDKKYELSGNVRFTRRLYKTLNESNPIIIDSPEKMMSQEFNQFTQFNPQIEESATYDNAPSYHNGNKSYSFPVRYNKNESYLGLGGYVYMYTATDMVDPGSNVVNMTKVGIIKEQLFDYFDNNKTCLFIMDFILVEYELNYVIPITFVIKFANNGVITLLPSIDVLYRDIYRGTESLVRAAFEIFITLLIIWYFVFLVIVVRGRVIHKYNKLKIRLIRKKKKKYAKKDECFLDVNLTDAQLKKIDNKLGSRLFILFRVFLKERILVVQFLNLILSFTCIVIWFLFVKGLYSHINEIDNFFISWKYSLSLNSQNAIHLSAMALETYRGVVCINFLILFIKIITLMSKYFNSTNIFINTLISAFSDLLSFFIFFFTLLLAISLASYTYFGQKVSQLNNFLQSLQFNLSFCLGIIDTDIYQSMIKMQPEMTLVFFFFIILFVKFIVIQILLAIIIHFFKISMDDYDKAKNLHRSKEKYIKSIVGHSELVQALNYYRKANAKVFNLFACKCNKKGKAANRPVAKAVRSKSFGGEEIAVESRKSILALFGRPSAEVLKREEEEKLKAQAAEASKMRNVKDVELFNTPFDEDLALVMKDAYFDSERDNYLLKDTYEKKYRNIFIQAFFFLIFLAVFILMVLFHTVAPWHYNLQEMLYLKMDAPIFNKMSKSEQLMNINSIDAVRKFIFFGLPSIFDKKSFDPKSVGSNYTNLVQNIPANTTLYSLLEVNSVLQNSLLVTVKKSNNDPGHNVSSLIRESGSLSISSKMSNENRTSFILNNTDYIYRTRQSYRGYGGYTFQIHLPDVNTSNYYPEDQMNTYIDYFTSFVVVEFVLQNPEDDFLAYVSITFTFDYGDYFDIDYFTETLQYTILTDYMDYIELTAEIVLLILLVYQWVVFFESIIVQSKAYDVWYKDFVLKLNLKTQELRHYYMPEIFRKLYYILDISKAIEITILITSTYIILLRIHIYILQSQLNNYSSERGSIYSIYSIRQVIYNSIDDKASYMAVGAVAIFLCSVRLSIMINLGKYFSLLIRTIQDSKANNITFITILIFIEPAFFFYSYLKFGETDSNFKSLDLSIMTCLQMLFGSIEFREFYNDDQTFGPLFFFLYVFIINMILLNLFVAVVYSSYIKVKGDIKKSREKWSGRRVFFFCCYRKKQYFLGERKDQLSREFEYEKLARGYKTQMNIHVKCPAEEWRNAEINEIATLNQILYKNSNTLHEMKTSMSSNQSLVHEKSKYQNVEDRHLQSFQMFYLKTLISISEHLEKDTLTIDKYRNYLKGFKEVNTINEKIDELKLKNDSNLNRAAVLEKKVVDLEADLENLRKLNEGLHNLHVREEDLIGGFNTFNKIT